MTAPPRRRVSPGYPISYPSIATSFATFKISFGAFGPRTPGSDPDGTQLSIIMVHPRNQESQTSRPEPSLLFHPLACQILRGASTVVSAAGWSGAVNVTGKPCECWRDSRLPLRWREIKSMRGLTVVISSLFRNDARPRLSRETKGFGALNLSHAADLTHQPLGSPSSMWVTTHPHFCQAKQQLTRLQYRQRRLLAAKQPHRNTPHPMITVFRLSSAEVGIISAIGARIDEKQRKKLQARIGIGSIPTDIRCRWLSPPALIWLRERHRDGGAVMRPLETARLGSSAKVRRSGAEEDPRIWEAHPLPGWYRWRGAGGPWNRSRHTAAYHGYQSLPYLAHACGCGRKATYMMSQTAQRHVGPGPGLTCQFTGSSQVVGKDKTPLPGSTAVTPWQQRLIDDAGEADSRVREGRGWISVREGGREDVKILDNETDLQNFPYVFAGTFGNGQAQPHGVASNVSRQYYVRTLHPTSDSQEYPRCLATPCYPDDAETLFIWRAGALRQRAPPLVQPIIAAAISFPRIAPEKLGNSSLCP
ncbi:hypothetical protein G7046_g5888 [Stylonectria norvegica]|nr:hypothetical protein G7046_g5888 [Stylonectria norvegica]